MNNLSLCSVFFLMLNACQKGTKNLSNLDVNNTTTTSAPEKVDATPSITGVYQVTQAQKDSEGCNAVEKASDGTNHFTFFAIQQYSMNNTNNLRLRGCSDEEECAKWASNPFDAVWFQGAQNSTLSALYNTPPKDNIYSGAEVGIGSYDEASSSCTGLMYVPHTLTQSADGSLLFTKEYHRGSAEPETKENCTNPTTCCNDALLKKVSKTLPCTSSQIIKAKRIGDVPTYTP